jgi:hypothetical protein
MIFFGKDAREVLVNYFQKIADGCGIISFTFVFNCLDECFAFRAKSPVKVCVFNASDL